MGARVSLIAPPTLIPREAEAALGVDVSTDVRDVADADVVYVLRMQLERMGPGGFVPSLREYAATYGIGHDRLRPGQRVMHAGPINRGVEITGALADDPATLIVRQAANGMIVRMAVLYDLLVEPASAAEPAEQIGAVAIS
jgi:aspartate carbamoyltransferase catalytic subunit